MTLDVELLQVLTAGDKVRMEEILSRQEHGAGQIDGQVAVNVHGAAPGRFLLGVASNGNTALHLVASRGHAELATLLCERAPLLAATRNKCLDTPLHCAARFGHANVAAVLLRGMRAGGAEEESALRARNQSGATALYEAVRHGRAGVVDLLMTEVPDLASVDSDEVSPLYLAASTDSVQMVRALLRPSQGGTPSPASFSGPEGRTALHAAAASSKEMAEAILSWGPEGPTLLTRADSSGSTPLHFAVLYGRLDVVVLFLDGHASLGLASISDGNGSFPLHIAAMVEQTRIMEELVHRIPDCYEMVDGKGRNILHCAVEHGRETVVRHICRNDKFSMLWNATDSGGNTPLHLAAHHGYPKIVILLLKTTSVETSITNNDGLTAMDLAIRAIVPGRMYYFQDPHIIVGSCLGWLGAAITLDGVHPLYLRNVYDKPTREEASHEQDMMTESGIIGSVLIATMAFGAAFTVPGGFVADDHGHAGTATLARRFAFRAFVVSDTMAFLCSLTATCFLIYGGVREIPRAHRYLYNLLASGLVPVGAQCMIAAFAFGFHLILGSVNRWLIVLVYTLSLASLLPWHLGSVPFGAGEGDMASSWMERTYQHTRVPKS
ncbi:hypothetical protein VPH35_036518 [Triticum aestivum]